MRIYYVLNSRWPTVKAHGLQVAKTCEALQQAGVTVELIVPRRAEYRQTQGADPFTLYGIRERFRIVRLPSVDFTNGKLFFGIQQMLFALTVCFWIFLKKGVIYTRDPFTAYWMSLFRREVFWEAHRFPGNPRSPLYRGILARVAGIVVITHGLKALFVQCGVSERRLAVIPDAVDPDVFSIAETTDQARERLNLPRGRSVIGYVGQLSTLGEEKGVADLLRAYARVRESHPDAVLLIVGGTEYDIAQYASLAERLGLNSREVLFAGHQPHERVPLYLRACDVLVMPYPNTSHYAHYMSPLKLFEYMAAGKPIVTTDLPSVREIVGSSDVVFVRAGNPTDLADGIGMLLKDPLLLNQKGKSALLLARKHSWKGRAKNIIVFASHMTKAT